MPKFSIIIPCYNVASWLRAALDSVLAQSYGDYEAICVDDGSKDETGKILDEYATLDSRIKVIHQENRGEGGARSAGLRVALGEWLVYLDADDVWHTKFLESMVEGMRLCPDAQIVKVKSISFDDGQSIVWSEPAEVKSKILDYSSELTSEVYDEGIWCWAYLRSAVGDIMFDKGFVVGEDRAYVGAVVARTTKNISLDVPRYGYRQRASSAAHAKLSARKLSDEIRWRKYQAELWCNETRQLKAKEIRFSAACMLEFIALDYFTLPLKERKEVFPVLIGAIRLFLKIKRIPPWYRFAMTIVSALPFELTLFILGTVPQWLKTKGLHR